MSFVYLSPNWFFGYDVALELAFAIISLVLALFAFKIFKISNQKQVRLFGIAFLLISISYFIQSIFNFLIISEMNERICQVIELRSIILFDAFGIYTHMLFMTIGLVILTYMTLKANKKRIFWLLLSLSLLLIFLSRNKLYLFFVMSSIYLIFISWHFITNYWKHRHKKTLLVAIAFLFLLFGNMHFIFAINQTLFYAIGHILELFAYLLILWNFYLVLKNGSKKRKA